MTAFIRRFRDLPGLETLTAIEQVALIDRTPSTPVVGVGFGTLLIVGEFEDGLFNTPAEVFGENDEKTKFGGFGYTYGDLRSQNPCARIHLSEHWNGNGFLKGKNLQPNRKIICRVDTSVGDVRFTLAAALRSDPGPFDLDDLDQLSVTTDTGGPASSTALSAAVATRAGSGFAGTSGYTGGEQIGITIDANTEVIISFQAADSTPTQVAARINSFLGYTGAVVNVGEVDISGIVAGTSGSVTLRDVTDPGGGTTLSAIGHTAGSTAGTGNVADSSAVTAAEAATLINSAGIAAINGVAVVDADTQEVIVYRTGSGTGTVQVDDVVGAMATEMGFTTATTITANVGAAFTLSAGTRVRDASSNEWIVMRTISWPEGTASAPNAATQDVEVRPGLDDGSGVSAIAGAVDTVVDFPSDRMVEVTNPSNLSAALTETQIDSRYSDAFDATLDPRRVSRAVTSSISARRSTNVVRFGQQNAIDASNEGNQGRAFHTRAPIGYTSSQAISDVTNWRIDRVFYSWPNWRMFVEEIADVGAAGGTGFSDDGIIDIGADGPLAYINCRINPEENPGQDTKLLGFLTGLEEVTETLNRQLYTSLKDAGICAPRVDFNGNFVYQSEQTAELTPGRKTQKRRKMADFIQDSVGIAMIPYSKKLATDNRRAGIDTDIDSFLGGLLSENNPDFQRIGGYSVEDTTSENPDLAKVGIEVRKIKVELLNSLDTIVIDTEIGEGVVVVREV